MWYAGIDWSDTHHDVVVIDEVGERTGQIRVTHNANGLAKLVDFLKGIGDIDQHPKHMACIIETSHGLLINSLLEAGLPVYPVNPKTVDQHRNPSGAKTDAIDAYLLGKKGRSDIRDLRRLEPDSPIIEELKVLTHDQDTLIQSQTRLINQLKACLKEYCPVAIDLFFKLAQPSTLAFLKAYPSLESARDASIGQIAGVLKDVGYAGADAKARQIKQLVSQPQMETRPSVSRAKARLMLALVSQLESLMREITAYDEEIQRLFRMHSDSRIFDSLPGAGKRLAPRLLAEWGDDRDRYQDVDASP